MIVNAQLARIEDLANQHYFEVEGLYDLSAGLHYYRNHDFYMNRLRQQQKQKTHKASVYWVTINPDNTKVTLTAFMDIIEQLTKRPFFVNCSYCFEQRGKTDNMMGDGLHCHILFDKKVGKETPQKVQDNIYSTLKGIVGNKKSIDVRVYPAEFREEKTQYMLGKKWDAGKEDSCKLNLKWRAQNNINNLYIVN